MYPENTPILTFKRHLSWYVPAHRGRTGEELGLEGNPPGNSTGGTLHRGCARLLWNDGNRGMVNKRGSNHAQCKKKGRSFWYYAVEIRAATGSTLDLIISTLRVG
jgi:hypothetical protein